MGKAPSEPSIGESLSRIARNADECGTSGRTITREDKPLRAVGAPELSTSWFALPTKKRQTTDVPD
jgi:predicted DNA-binding transcriptional regulator YafY